MNNNLNVSYRNGTCPVCKKTINVNTASPNGICPNCRRIYDSQNAITLYKKSELHLGILIIAIILVGGLILFGYSKYKKDLHNSINAKKQAATDELRDSLSINNYYVKEGYNGNKTLVVEYSWKNTTDKATAFIWQINTKCYQNGIECQKAIFVDGLDSGDASTDVLPGYTITVRQAYNLNDMSDVTIQCSKFVSSKPFYQTTLKLK